MDKSNQNKPNAPRKMKFAPKAPKRQPKVEVKSEPVEDTDSIQAKELLQRFNQSSLLRSKPKFERNVAASQTASYGGQSTKIRSYGFPKVEFGGVNSRVPKKEKEYIEPYDPSGYCPVTHPLRVPFSGDPEFLNEMEFGEAAQNITLDENSIIPAEELGLLEENLEPTLFFVQLPSTLPMVKKSASAGEQKVDASSRQPARPPGKEKAIGLNELPAGLVGKLQIYKSGAVKWKIGDTLYDVSTGSECMFTQEVMAINTEKKHCCVVGELDKRMIIRPDVDSILDCMMNDLKL